MSGDEDSDMSSPSRSPFGLRSSPTSGTSPRSGTRVRSPNSRYLVDLGYDNVPRRRGGEGSMSRAAGGEADPISLDLSGSIDAGVEEEAGSSVSAGAGSRAATGGRGASRSASETDGRRKRRAPIREQEEEEEEEEEESEAKRGRHASTDSAQSKARLFSGLGEFEVACLAVQDATPWGFSSNAARKKAWADVARMLLEPQTLDITRDGVVTKVKVDYRQGRSLEEYEDAEELGSRIQRAWGDRAKKLEREEKASGKKTGEGTMTADEANTEDTKNSEEYQLMISLQYQNAAKEQRLTKTTVPMEMKRKAFEVRERAAGIGAAGGGPAGGARAGAATGRGGGRGGRSGRGRGTPARGRGRGAAASGRGTGSGGRGAAAGGRGIGNGTPSSGASGAGNGPRRQARGRSHHQHNSGVGEGWEVREFLSPPPPWGGAPSGGPGGDGGGSGAPVVLEGEESPDVDPADADDAEAQALSAGMLGRQTRGAKGGGGSVRRQVYRGDPAGGGGDLCENIGAAISLMMERNSNPPPSAGAAVGGGVVDPRVTALQVGLEQNNEGLAATTRIAQQSLELGRQTNDAVGRLAAVLEARLPLPPPPAPSAYPYWPGGVAPPLIHNQAPQGVVSAGGVAAAPLSSASSAAVRVSPPLPSFTGAMVVGAGPAGAGATGADPASVGPSESGSVNAQPAAVAPPGIGAVSAGPALGASSRTNATAPSSRAPSVVNGVARATESRRDGRGTGRDARGLGGERQKGPRPKTAAGDAGGRGAPGPRAVGVRAPTFTNPTPWKP